MHCGDGLGVGWGKAATVEQMNDGSRQQAAVNAYLIDIPSYSLIDADPQIITHC